MKKRTKTLLLTIAVVLSMGATAQNEGTRFTLEEAQQYAMQNSYVLQNTSLDVISAQRKVWETITIGLPQISGTFDYTKNISAAKQPFPVAIIPKDFWPYIGIPEDTPPDGTYPISFAQKYSSNYGFTVSQLLFDGSYIVGIGSSQVYLNLSKQVHEKSKIDIRDAVAQAYYYVLVGEENKIVMVENLENTKKLYEETLEYYKNGFREEQDVDQMKLLVKNAENEILKADREINISKVVLKYTMGYPIDAEISLMEGISSYLNPILEANDSQSFDFSDHIDYKLSVSNYMASEKLLKLEKSTFLPRISMFYNWSKTSFGNNANLFKSSVNWFPSSMVGLNLSMPIFNSGQKIFKVQQARINLEKAENDRMFSEITLQKDYLTAKANFESAIDKYHNDVENRQLAEKIKDKTKIKFQNGLSGSTELSQIETQYIQAYGSYIGSALQLLQADLALKKALGKL
ncbi:MAG: TolC family protein [Prolixibacteraceae bacterium]|nr:TolC family protein [Prolixibacteraceae bacterium]MBN2773333.1 TolC family protein [Prolixibacteraceae bacterium]